MLQILNFVKANILKQYGEQFYKCWFVSGLHFYSICEIIFIVVGQIVTALYIDDIYVNKKHYESCFIRILLALGVYIYKSQINHQLIIIITRNTLLNCKKKSLYVSSQIVNINVSNLHKISYYLSVS